MYQSGDTIVCLDEHDLIQFIKTQFANGATLMIDTPTGLKTIKVRKL